MSWLSNLFGEKGITTKRSLSYEQAIDLFEKLSTEIAEGKTEIPGGIKITIYPYLHSGRYDFSDKKPSDIIGLLENEAAHHINCGAHYLGEVRETIIKTGESEDRKLNVGYRSLESTAGGKDHWGGYQRIADIRYKTRSKGAKCEVELEK